MNLLRAILTLIIAFTLLLLYTCVSFHNSEPAQYLSTLKSTSLNQSLTTTYYLINQSQLDSAKAILDSLLSYYPGSATVHFQMGLLYSQKDSLWQLAEFYFKRAINLKRNYPEAYYQLGMLYLNGPFHKEDAISMFDAAIRRRKNYKEALFQRALTIIKYPTDAEFKLDLVSSLYRCGKYSEALVHLDSLKSESPNYQICLLYLNEARIRFALQQDSLAAFFLEPAVNQRVICN